MNVRLRPTEDEWSVVVAEDAQSWLQVTKSSNEAVHIEYSTNTGPARRGSISISARDQIKRLVISQATEIEIMVPPVDLADPNSPYGCIESGTGGSLSLDNKQRSYSISYDSRTGLIETLTYIPTTVRALS